MTEAAQSLSEGKKKEDLCPAVASVMYIGLHKRTWIYAGIKHSGYGMVITILAKSVSGIRSVGGINTISQ